MLVDIIAHTVRVLVANNLQKTLAKFVTIRPEYFEVERDS